MNKGGTAIIRPFDKDFFYFKNRRKKTCVKTVKRQIKIIILLQQ